MKYSGLIGYPVAHSLSPQMQDAGFAALGIAARYELWETPLDRLEARVQGLRAPEMFGANVTIPHKEAVLPWLDECDPQAARIGAVNTIVNRQGRLVGYNTDAPGFLRAVEEGAGAQFEIRGKRVAMLGSGGAARGAAVALLDAQVHALTILGRTREHIEALLTDLRHLPDIDPVAHASGKTGGPITANSRPRVAGELLGTAEADLALSQADVLINTTSVGLKAGDQALLIDVNLLPVTTLVMDMIFNPPRTPLLQAASARGCAVLNGLSMLLYQGTLALELWTGRPAPVAVMRKALGL